MGSLMVLFIYFFIIHRDIGLSKKDEHRPPRRTPGGGPPPPPMEGSRERQLSDPCK